MIKLKSLIKKESIDNALDDTPRIGELIEEIQKNINIMGMNSTMLWRGMNAKFPFIKVVHDRDRFRGSNLGAKTIMKELNIKAPVFAHFHPTLTGLFGRTYALVLKSPYKIYQSPVVDDVMAYAQAVKYKETRVGGGLLRQQIGTRTEEEIVELATQGAKTYKELTNIKPLSGQEYNEVIIDCNEYWCIEVGHIITTGGKFMPVKFDKAKDIKTYSELSNILSAYRKFRIWKWNTHNKE